MLLTIFKMKKRQGNPFTNIIAHKQHKDNHKLDQENFQTWVVYLMGRTLNKYNIYL